MRLHTDKITSSDIYAAVRGLTGVYVDVIPKGSRSREWAFEVSLEGNGYRKNSGKYGAGEEIGATWDEWGVFLASLFDVDPDAFWGSASYKVYDGAEDFHNKTGNRFMNYEDGLPEDTHKRHHWEGVRGARHCTKCSAEQWD